MPPPLGGAVKYPAYARTEVFMNWVGLFSKMHAYSVHFGTCP